MTNAKPSFLRKAKGYKKHGAIAVLFVFVEMVCLSAYRGRFYEREGYLSSFAYKLYHFEIRPKPVRMTPRRVAPFRTAWFFSPWAGRPPFV